MRIRFLFSIFTCVALAWAGVAPGERPATQPASPAMADLTGVIRRPLEMGESKAGAIFFIAVDCPISNGYAPEINRICKEYESKGLILYLAYPDADVPIADAKKHSV